MILTEHYYDAIELAYEIHGQQLRKSGEVPVVAHLLAVSSMVLQHGGSETEAIAALLHDAIEDGGEDFPADEVRERIAGEFGADVLAIVEGCTDADTTPKAPWKERKDAHLAKLERMTDGDLYGESIHNVYMADKIDFARSLAAAVHTTRHYDDAFAPFKGGTGGTLWYLYRMYNALHLASHSMRAEFSGALDWLEREIRLSKLHPRWVPQITVLAEEPFGLLRPDGSPVMQSEWNKEMDDRLMAIWEGGYAQVRDYGWAEDAEGWTQLTWRHYG